MDTTRFSSSGTRWSGSCAERSPARSRPGVVRGHAGDGVPANTGDAESDDGGEGTPHVASPTGNAAERRRGASSTAPDARTALPCLRAPVLPAPFPPLRERPLPPRLDAGGRLGPRRRRLGRQRGRADYQGGHQAGDQPTKIPHHRLPRALPRHGVDRRRGMGRRQDGGVKPGPRIQARKLSRARARLTCRRRLSAFSLICRTRSRVIPSRLPISSSVIGSGPSSPK